MLNRIRWRDPARAAVVIFDRSGSELLAQTVLEGLPHAVLECRGERFHLGPRLLWNLLAALHRIDRHWLRTSPRGVLRALRGELYKIYLHACLRCMRPRVVLTFIDNNRHFGWLSRHASGPAYYAVQNGVRNRDDLLGQAGAAPPHARRMDFPLLFSFGDQEAELYRELGQRVDRFVPVGSVRADWYRARFPTRPARRYDLCIVSQWSPEMLNDGSVYRDIQCSLRTLDGYVARFVDETRCTLCIALRTDSAPERAYFEGAYGARAEVAAKDAAAMSSYALVEQSEVSLAMDSTILREAYAWGRKTLFCNYSGRDENHSSPVVDLCYLGEPDYERFRDRLRALLSMDAGEYRARTRENAHHLMRFDPGRPSFRVIRDAVQTALAAPEQGSIAP